jgi:hypothetical protein
MFFLFYLIDFNSKNVQLSLADTQGHKKRNKSAVFGGIGNESFANKKVELGQECIRS